MTVTKVAAAKLVEDFSIYPRHQVDRSHVQSLARALMAGEELPPVLAEKGTYRLVDGFHRRRAYVVAFGDGARVPTELRVYRSPADLLREAVALNSAHGRRLTSQDLTRSAILLKEAGVEEELIAVTMHTTPEQVQRVLLRIVEVEGELQPAKPSQWPPKGEPPRRITREQAEVHRTASGWRHAQTIRTLTNELRADLVDVERHAELLQELRSAIDVALGAVAVG